MRIIQVDDRVEWQYIYQEIVCEQGDVVVRAVLTPLVDG